RVREILERFSVTHWDLPPSLLCRLELSDVPPSIRTLVIGGEPCPPEVVARWAGQRRVVVVYGPTEATVCTSMEVVDPQTWDAPYIGAPIPGARYHVVDSQD